MFNFSTEMHHKKVHLIIVGGHHLQAYTENKQKTKVTKESSSQSLRRQRVITEGQRRVAEGQ